MDKNVKHYPLAHDVEMPQHCAYVVRDLPQATVEQRERALNATHWNEFAFPAGLLTVDMLSDSGTTAMTNQQWATLMLGDEAYGRNTGYYVLLDTFRDIFERGGEKNWKKSIDLVRTDCRLGEDDGRSVPLRVRGRPVQRRRRSDGAPQRLYHSAGPCR